jgi:HAMP domain-containing protein
VTPIAQLTTVADEFSRGKMDLAIPDLDRRDEIGNLARSFERLGTSTRLAMERLKGRDR